MSILIRTLVSSIPVTSLLHDLQFLSPTYSFFYVNSLRSGIKLSFFQKDYYLLLLFVKCETSF